MDHKQIIQTLTDNIKTVNENFVVEYDMLTYNLMDDEELDAPEIVEELAETYEQLTVFLDILKDRAVDLEDNLKDLLH